MQDSSSAPAQPSHVVAPEDRVPTAQKVAYGLGTTNDMWGNWLYPSMVWPVYNIFLHVSPALVSMALMINRLADAVSDPFYGWLSDNTRSRFGRRRPFILLGSILSGLTLPALFLVSPSWSETTLFVYMLISSGVYITIVSCFNMPFQSLGNELTPDYHERTSVFAYKSAIQKVPEVAMFAAAAFVTASVWIGATAADVPARLGRMASQCAAWLGRTFAALFTADLSALADAAKTPFGWKAEEGANVLLGAQVYAVLLGTIMIVVGIIVFAVVKERYYDKVVEIKQDRVRLTETLYKTLKCRPFRAQLAMALAYGMGTSMLGTLGYYLTVYYVCAGNVALGSIWNFGMGLASMLFGLLGIPVYAFVARHLGKRPAMMCVQLAAIAVFIASFWLYNPAIPWLQFFASGLISFNGGAFWMLYGAIGADVIDYDELEMGKRREGAFSACGTYIMKVGLALGIGLSGVVLGATGFDSKLGGDQSPDTIWNIRVMFAVIPIVGLAIALVALAMFGLSREKMAEIREKLEERRGKV